MVGEAEVNVDCDFSRRRCLRCGGPLQSVDVWWSTEEQSPKAQMSCGVTECGFSWGFLGDEMRYVTDRTEQFDLEAMDAVPAGSLAVFGEVG